MSSKLHKIMGTEYMQERTYEAFHEIKIRMKTGHAKVFELTR